MTLLAAEDFNTPWAHVPGLLLPAYVETWVMVGTAMALVVLVGVPPGIVLHNTSDLGLFPDARTFRVLNTIVNVGRSLPFLILMVWGLEAARRSVFSPGDIATLQRVKDSW